MSSIPFARPISIPAEFEAYHAQPMIGLEQFKYCACLADYPKPPDWPVITDPAYWELKKQLKAAEARRAAVPSLSTMPWSAGYRWTQAERRHADSEIRRAKRRIAEYRKQHHLGTPRKFWKPRAGATLSPRVAKRFDPMDTLMWTWLVEPVSKQLRDIREHLVTSRYVLGSGGRYQRRRHMNREGLAQYRFIRSMRAA